MITELKAMLARISEPGTQEMKLRNDLDAQDGKAIAVIVYKPRAFNVQTACLNQSAEIVGRVSLFELDVLGDLAETARGNSPDAERAHMFDEIAKLCRRGARVLSRLAGCSVSAVLPGRKPISCDWVSIDPVKFDRLEACGLSGSFAARRESPSVTLGLLFNPQQDEVYAPPFGQTGEWLTSVGEVMSRGDFEWHVWDGRAVRYHGVPARSDGCFYLPPGDGAPEYTSMAIAAERLASFADEKLKRGDILLQRGDPEMALKEYELAAAAAQTPESYERMLRLPLPDRRRARIQAQLDQLSNSATVRGCSGCGVGLAPHGPDCRASKGDWQESP